MYTKSRRISILNLMKKLREARKMLSLRISKAYRTWISRIQVRRIQNVCKRIIRLGINLDEWIHKSVISERSKRKVSIVLILFQTL